mgnify:CR=1 FL=1
MPSSRKVETALENFRRAFAAGRMPHAVLVAGHPRGAGTEFVEGLLALAFGVQDPARLRQHADVRWIEPESKSRQIKVEDQIRPLIDFIGLTSYEGGWKAGVILFADRLNANAQNALLKTLEEPPPNSLLILATDVPAALLPTIRSRAQFVDVRDDERPADSPWLATVVELLRNPPTRQACEMLAWTDRLTAPLRSLEELAEAEETARAEAATVAREGEGAELTRATKGVVEGRVAARVKEMREEILRTIQLWQRDVLANAVAPDVAPEYFPDEAAAIAAQAAGLSLADAAKRVAAVDEVRELMEHNIRDEAALPRLARAVARPRPT